MTKTTMHPAPVGTTGAPAPSPTEGGLTVAFVRWPAGEDERRRLAVARVPRLLIVDPGVAPPADWGADEDWVRLPADPEDVRLRVQELCRRTGASAPPPDSLPSMGSVTPIS